jgi:hypothetical protein
VLPTTNRFATSGDPNAEHALRFDKLSLQSALTVWL